jgi:glycosyltransferase involved in cell wall biosynthesis
MNEFAEAIKTPTLDSKVPEPVATSTLVQRESKSEIQKLRVAIVGTVGLPARYGGFETLAHYLVEHLGEEFDFTVYCSGPDYKERPKDFLGARLVYFPLRANGVQSIPFDILNYFHALKNCDILLVLGVSGGLALPLVRLLGKPSILNIGGLDWQRSKWGRWASRFLHLSEAIAVRSASVVVSDNLGISHHLQTAYKTATTLIEYGGDQTTKPEITEALVKKYPFLSRPYAFAVARIQSDNNPELLLYAYNQVPEVEFVFIGNWNRSEYGRELKKHYQVFPNLHLLEAIYDPLELNVIRANCAYYVHGHSSGGTNPALVEAMNLSLPIASFDVVYNRATTENRVKYFRNVATLVELILQVPQSEWDQQREVVKDIALRRYRWEGITKKYAEIFRKMDPRPKAKKVTRSEASVSGALEIIRS